MKRILIDGRFVGVGDSQTRYVLELVRNILKFDQENEYTLLVRPQGMKDVEEWLGIPRETMLDVNKSQISNDKSQINSKFKIQNSKFQNLQVEVLDIPHYSVAEQTKLLKYLNDKKFDLVHFTQFNHPIFYRGNYVITIQDLTLVGHLHYFNFVKQLAFNSVMKSAARDSKAIIAISKVTEDDVIDFFGTPKEKFSLIYHGIDHVRFNAQVTIDKRQVTSFKDKYKITGDYFLYTGMWKKHKNLMRLLKAYEVFCIKYQAMPAGRQVSSIKEGAKVEQNHTPRLVLVGKVDQSEPEIIAEINRIDRTLDTKYKIQNTILTTGFIDEDELPLAYAGALAYCIPSLSEGFGWPPLEAMACGTPAIASNASCIPEILGDAALYFDPYDVSDIAAKMEDISKDEALRKKLISKGLEQVKKYSWEECAKKTLEAYQKLLS